MAAFLGRGLKRQYYTPLQHYTRSFDVILEIEFKRNGLKRFISSMAHMICYVYHDSICY